MQLNLLLRPIPFRNNRITLFNWREAHQAEVRLTPDEECFQIAVNEIAA